MSKKKCARTKTPRYSYFHLIVNSWNILHMDIRTAYCTGNFKFKVKKFLTGKSWFHYTEFFFVCIICIYWSAFTWGLELLQTLPMTSFSLVIAFSRTERTHPNFVSKVREIEIFCEDCKLAIPLGFLRALGLVFVYIDSSPLDQLRMYGRDFLHAFVHTTHFAIIILHVL